MFRIVVLGVAVVGAAAKDCASTEASLYVRSKELATLTSDAGVVVGTSNVAAVGDDALYCISDGCYSVAVDAPFTVSDEYAQLHECSEAPCGAHRLCVKASTVVAEDVVVDRPRDEFKNMKTQALSEKTLAARRMSEMFNNVRRLQLSYDFDSGCVNSLQECVDDSACDDDEECFFPETARKRTLRESEGSPAARSLLFGGNSVGQCVCK